MTTDPAAVPCDTCQRPAGQWCRTGSGAYSVPHKARIALALATRQGARYDAATYDQATYGERTSP